MKTKRYAPETRTKVRETISKLFGKGYSPTATAKAMNLDGFTAPNGRPLTSAQVSRYAWAEKMKTPKKKTITSTDFKTVNTAAAYSSTDEVLLTAIVASNFSTEKKINLIKILMG